MQKADQVDRHAELADASRTVALGMLASRASGFLRTVVIAGALGLGSRLLDAYNAANTMPNTLYDLLLGGVLSSIAIPLIVRASLQSKQIGTETSARMLAFVTVALGGAVVLTTLAAPLLINLYAVHFDAAERQTAIVLIRFFVPQILFYGLSAVLGAIANANGHFRLPAWAPVANNLVVIAVALTYLALGGRDSLAAMSPWRLDLLGLGTTFGIVLQTLLLVPLLKRCGVTWRAMFSRNSFPSRGAITSLAPRVGWIVMYVSASQALFLVISRSATGAGPGALGVFANAYAIFQVPYTIVAVSVMTAIMPKLSAHGAQGNDARMTTDLSLSLRLIGCLMMPIVALFLVLGPSIASVLFAHGGSTADAVHLTGKVLMVFGIALIPFTAFQVLVRSFYAMEDTRTPGLVNVMTNVVAILTCVACSVVFHGTNRDMGLAFAYCTGYGLGIIILGLALQRRLGRIDGRIILRTHVRVLIAGALAASLGFATRDLLERAVGHGFLDEIGISTAVALFVLVTFWGLSRVMHVEEIGILTNEFLPHRARLHVR